MDLDVVYFYTATILDWKHLLKQEKFKRIVIESLKHLVEKGKMKVYAFVIMPNHIHLIWENLELNGKEMPYVSFMKFTGHGFQRRLREEHPGFLNSFKVENRSRNYNFWQRNSLPVAIFSRQMLEQKLNYIHLNPLQSHWNLADDPNDYIYSSCSFYEQNDLRYEWLTHYREVF